MSTTLDKKEKKAKKDKKAKKGAKLELVSGSKIRISSKGKDPVVLANGSDGKSFTATNEKTGKTKTYAKNETSSSSISSAGVLEKNPAGAKGVKINDGKLPVEITTTKAPDDFKVRVQLQTIPAVKPEPKTSTPTIIQEKKKATKAGINSDSKVAAVYETFEYDKFSFREGNRVVDDLHVQELKISFSDFGYLMKPIDVNDKFEIIDGQHRFEACRQSGLPIHYMVQKDWGLKEIHVLNSHQVNWNSLDYLNAYKDHKTEYAVFKKFMDDYGFGFQISHTLLTNTTSAPRGSKFKIFRKGLFSVGDLQEAVDVANMIKDFLPYYERATKRDAFCLAIIRLARRTDYDHKEMMEKMESNSGRFHEQSLVIDFIKNLEAIYNKNRRRSEWVRWA